MRGGEGERGGREKSKRGFRIVVVVVVVENGGEEE